MVKLKNFFEPRKIAVIGVSRNPAKVGHVIFKNIIDGGFETEGRKVYPVNPKADEILRREVYGSVGKIKDKIDLAVIAVPAGLVIGVVKECNRAGIKDVLIVSSGFSEVGEKALEEHLSGYIRKNKMRAIGVNCLGIFDAYNKLDTLFIPRFRLKRPDAGKIGFVCQSGAIGAAIMDIATERGHKFSKFVSYGNATDVDESDLLEYLGNDKNTKVICLYVEGIKDGEKFYRTLRSVSKKKPIIALKGGLTEEGSAATVSHTGALAGKKEVYFGVFRQTGVIRAESLEEMFNIAALVEKGADFTGNRVQVITNGGGYGIIATDNIIESENLAMASLSNDSVKRLRKEMPKTVNIRNPLDLVGDATTERYGSALNVCVKDKGVDALFVIVLYQTPLIGKDVADVIASFGKGKK